MQYIGLDAHKSQWTFCVLDENGKKVLTKTVHGDWPVLMKALETIPRPFKICFEASCGAGFLHDTLKKIAAEVIVANPNKLALIYAAKRKNDRLDAEHLAKLLFLELVPRVHIPKSEVRAWRSLIEYRRRLMGGRTTIKNRLRALLRGAGKIVPTPSLWSRVGLAWLAAEAFDQPMDAVHRDILVSELTEANEKIRKVTGELDKIGDSNSNVTLLMTIPGVGIRTAEAFVAYIDEAKRFSKTKTIGSYLGVVPTQDQSSTTNHLGRITRQGPSAVRWLLTEAAWEGVRRSPQIRAFYERIRRNDPQRNKIAAVATAHYLARVMLAMMQSGEAWRETSNAASPTEPKRKAS
jgi:transposase